MDRPSFLICFPRSGSNFLQNLLKLSGVCAARSIYAPNRDGKFDKNFKSHAMTPDSLRHEMSSLLGIGSPSFFKDAYKIIWLIRDPRDAMISFYEYSKHKLERDIDQREFVGNFPFPFIPPIGADGRPSVIDFYRASIHSWRTYAGLTLRYEDLLDSPEATFLRVSSFLAAPQSIKDGALDEKVSQHSSEDRPRGKSQGWRELRDRYGVIIDGVESRMTDELSILGFA